MAWIGAVAGLAAGVIGANQSNSNARNSGRVDIHSTPQAYAGSMPYRDAAAQAAYRLQFGEDPPAGSPGSPFWPQGGAPNPRGGGGVEAGTTGEGHPGGGNRLQGAPQPSTAGTVTRPDGRVVPASPPPQRGARSATNTATRGGGGAPPAARPTPAAPFQGQSSQTGQAIDNAMRAAGEMEGGRVNQAATNYSANTLAGRDQNAYRGETADMIRDMDTADYDRYVNLLFGSDTGLGGAAGGGASGGGQQPNPNFVRFQASGTRDRTAAAQAMQAAAPVQTSGPTEADKAIKSILAGEDVPGAQAMRDRIKRQAEEGFNEQLRQRRLEAAGSGMYGGTGQLTDEAFAEGRFGSGLADAYAQQDFDTYRQALGLGAGFDTASLDRAAQERIAAANRDAAERSSSSSASAAAAMQGAELASRERMGRLGALSDAIGMGLNTNQFRASGMGSLAEGFSGDQRNALNAAPDTAGIGMAGWMGAGGLSLGSDQSRNAWQGSQNQLRASMANTSVARQGLQFDQERYANDRPWNDLARYQGIISGSYDPFTSRYEYGTDQRGASPSYTNVAGAGISGAAAGYQLGRDIYGGYSSGGS